MNRPILNPLDFNGPPPRHLRLTYHTPRLRDVEPVPKGCLVDRLQAAYDWRGGAQVQVSQRDMARALILLRGVDDARKPRLS